MKLSSSQTALMKRFIDEPKITLTRWVSGSRAGGDPNPRAFQSLARLKLARRLSVTHETVDKRYITKEIYTLTRKGEAFAKKL